MTDTPIGIIDSGFGGLSIYRHIVSLLPSESTIYIGDHAHLPYSKKSASYIQKRIEALTRFLLVKNAKLIVIACNTATVAGIELYRKKFPGVPIVGVVPVIKTAAAESKKKSFAVLSTDFTAQSQYQKELINRFAAGCKVYNLGGHSLVDFVEKGIVSGPTIRAEINKILPPSITEHIDILVLGCTHYPFLWDSFSEVIGRRIRLLDSGAAVARQVERIVKHNNIQSKNTFPTYEFFSTKKDASLSQVASALLGTSVTVTYALI